MKRPGGFPRRINRPATPVPATAVEAKPAAVEQLQPPRTGFPRLPTRPVPPALANDPPQATTRPAPPPLPVGEFFAAGDQDAGMDNPDSAGELFPEPYEDDDAPILTEPLPPPPRPEPTVLHPTPASRAAPPPVRLPGPGLLASNVGPRPSNRPSFLPPPRERGYIPAPPLPPAPSQAAAPPGAQPRPPRGAMPPPAGTAPPTSDRAFERLRKSPPTSATMAPPKPPVRKQPGPQPIDPNDIPFDL
jgi:hypothetical protein